MPKRKRRTTKKTKERKKQLSNQKKILLIGQKKKLQKEVIFYDSIPELPVEDRKLIVSFEFDDDQDFSDLLSKLNDIVYNIFSQGLNEAGYALASLQLNLMQSDGKKKSEIGLKYLKKLVSSYLQSLTTPHDYGILIHTYILHWFRLILIFEKRVNNWLDIISPKSKKEFEEEEIILNKNLNVKSIFDLFPTYNPEIYIPEIIEEDKIAIDDLFLKLGDKYDEIGLNFAKFYILNIKRFILDKEKLEYIFQIQMIIGQKLIEIGVERVEEFISGIAIYFYNLNKNLEDLLDSLSKKIDEKRRKSLKKKWEIYSRFSGTAFSEILKIPVKEK